jgi:anaerobic sulfite reductase subunit A
MGYALTKQQLNEYLKALGRQYLLVGPILEKAKGTFSDTDKIVYGVFEAFEDLVLEEKAFYSPKEFLMPIRETLFHFIDGQIVEPKIDTKPILIFARPCDLNGIRRLDTIFLKNGDNKDAYYERRRNLVKYVMIECTEGFNTCFCVSMGSNTYHDYEAAIRFDGNQALIEVVDPTLVTKGLSQVDVTDFVPEYIKENKVKVVIPPIDKVNNSIFEHALWKEYTRRCIACGRCNTSCITCSCFTMQDVEVSDDGLLGERRRVWASCHIKGYTDMAGGHGFRKQNGERMRFKTMHKINDYHKRFGEHMCVGCGRCDDVCPEYISFSKCINKLSEIIKEESHE